MWWRLPAGSCRQAVMFKTFNDPMQPRRHSPIATTNYDARRSPASAGSLSTNYEELARRLELGTRRG
jgi:hypothetical protein